jgi:hypothetical protein
MEGLTSLDGFLATPHETCYEPAGMSCLSLKPLGCQLELEGVLCSPRRVRCPCCNNATRYCRRPAVRLREAQKHDLVFRAVELAIGQGNRLLPYRPANRHVIGSLYPGWHRTLAADTQWQPPMGFPEQ